MKFNHETKMTPTTKKQFYQVVDDTILEASCMSYEYNSTYILNWCLEEVEKLKTKKDLPTYARILGLKIHIRNIRLTQKSNLTAKQ